MLTLAGVAGSDSILVERVRQHPNGARGVFFRLRAAGRTEDSAGGVALAAAERIAGAIAVAWSDSFYVREAIRFRELTPAQRRAIFSADSIADAGRAAVENDIALAMHAWHEALRRYETLGDSAGMVDGLNLLAIGFKNTEESDSILLCLRRAREVAARIGDQRGLARTLGEMGNFYRRHNDLSKSADLLHQAMQLFERIGDASAVTQTQGNLGVVFWSQGDLPGARGAFEAILAAARAKRDSQTMGWILHDLGGVAAEAGDYDEAVARLREALALYRAGGVLLDAADELLALGQLANRRGDYPAAVATLSEAAAIWRRSGPGAYGNEIDARLELAQTRSLMGDLQGARAELARGKVVAGAQHGNQRRISLAGLALARGDLAQTFNRFAEAEHEYELAKRLASGSTDREVTVRNRADQQLAAVLFRRGNYARAQLSAERILRRSSVDLHNKAQARLLFAEAAWRRGDTITARRAFTQALDTLRALGAAVDEADALATLGGLEAQAGRTAVAESLYRRGLTRLANRPAPGVDWKLHAGLAASLRRRGELDAAARELGVGITRVERVSGVLPLDEQRAAFRADKWTLYVELALVERERGRTAAAFEASERLRERQMLDLLARGRVASGDSAGTLASREQDLRRKIVDLTQRLESPPDSTELRDPRQPNPAAEGTRAALAQAEEAHGSLLQEMRAANPAYAGLVRGEIAPPAAVQSALGPDEALLEYLLGDSTALAFVVTADTLVALDLHLPHEALAARIDFARTTLANPTGNVTRRAWRAPMQRLYEQLIAPVEASGLLRGKRRLLVAPHAELHYLPFAALVSPAPEEQLLIERYVVEYVPSASVWLRLRERPAQAAGGRVLAMAPRAVALPGSQTGVAAIARVYGESAQTVVGRAATEHAFRLLAPAEHIVHLATYGVLNKDNPLFSYVELGAGGGDDGRLEVHEVFGLTLNARLLVLSACQTGVGSGAIADVPPGDDWVGLVQGFLYAGAGNVLGTLWSVHDRSTARFMERFYHELAAGKSEAQALAETQRAAVRDPRTAHPFYWASFILAGEP